MRWRRPVPVVEPPAERGGHDVVFVLLGGLLCWLEIDGQHIRLDWRAKFMFGTGTTEAHVEGFPILANSVVIRQATQSETTAIRAARGNDW